MTDEKILSHIDHTTLAPTTTAVEIATLCREATENGCAAVCLPPAYVFEAREILTKLQSKVALCTVIGFPWLPNIYREND